MISSIKGAESSLIETDSHRKFLESFETDILRGVGKLCVLKVIKNYGKEGIYGYALLKEVRELTNDLLIIKEGTLYPLLRNLKSWKSGGVTISLIKAVKKKEEGSEVVRTFYTITKEGEKLLNHMEGVFTKFTEAVAQIIDFNVTYTPGKFIYCPNCTNKVDSTDDDLNYCEVCGENLLKLKLKQGS